MVANLETDVAKFCNELNISRDDLHEYSAHLRSLYTGNISLLH
jgi:hypothetical protein